MTPQVQLLDFGCHDTSKNLPKTTATPPKETLSLNAFEPVYFGHQQEQLSQSYLLSAGREFALEGYGRADLLFIQTLQEPQSTPQLSAQFQSDIILTAFELKLTDWRKGLTQASRYRYFSNRSILVTPPKIAKTALSYIQTFKDLQIGLWEFNEDSLALHKHFTPIISKPYNPKANTKALNVLNKAKPTRALVFPPNFSNNHLSALQTAEGHHCP